MLAVERKQPCGRVRADGRGARDIAQQGDLAKGLARALRATEDPILEDLHLAVLDQVEAVAVVPLGDDLLARIDSELDDVVAQALQIGLARSKA